MKGILPASCRIIGYALLILSVFVPLLMYMFGMVDDTNLLYVKMSMKLVIWLSLFMVFLAKAKEEDAEAASLRSKAMQYALYVWGLYYIVLLVKGAVEGDLQVADNSVGIVYMVLNVLVWEFFLQKRRMEKMFRRK
ncbi:hypothetical protein [Phocaeicola acetigenes]|jgi:bacteriorhodopsin|uniref:Transmembrane protein n=1 Tax=Phocaeicola acetigenes TaxID=3016083 RepID=A0ABT4PK72_9BACT|nr:hypothetical protein [Phocaeicola sp. KGMB11183]MCZ8373458.1 hypothetical protein [Phocaeicola sp. KGMB11183]